MSMDKASQFCHNIVWRPEALVLCCKDQLAQTCGQTGCSVILVPVAAVSSDACISGPV